MQKKELIYEGKAKKVYATDDPELLIVDYKDDATAFNGLKKGTIRGKGIINNRMSNRLMQRLERAGIPTHFVKELSERETLVKRVRIVPLEVIVRNIAAGSFSKRYGVPEGTVFDAPTIEFSYKNDALGDPLTNTSHAVAMHLAREDEIETIKPRQRSPAHLLGGLWRDAGGLQTGVRTAPRRNDHPGRRDQPGHLPSMGQPDGQEAGQGSLPQRPGGCGGRLCRGHGPPV